MTMRLARSARPRSSHGKNTDENYEDADFEDF